MRRIPWVVVVIGLLCCFVAFEGKSEAASAQAYSEQLIIKAKQGGLAADISWRHLLFVVPGWFSRNKSLIDSDEFFLAPSGRTHPEAELEATLRALFDPTSRTRGKDPRHPQCAFPARLAWLSERLAIDPAQLPAVDCPELKRWLGGRTYQGISIVFSSYYPDNPASMFGHTFLQLHRRRGAGQAPVPLIDDAVNFSALMDTTNPIIYAAKGMAGGFFGRFSLMPYYLKIQEYNDLESRDLWEYDLDLSEKEIQRLVLSLWEVGPNTVDYYYMDDNCSFMLLALLESADQRIQLTDTFHTWVTPGDTLKAVAPFVKRGPTGVRYRPSARTRYVRRYELLAENERQALAQVLEDRDSASSAGDGLSSLQSLDESGRRRVLDALIDHIELMQSKKKNEALEVERLETERDWALALRRKVPGLPDAIDSVSPGHDPRSAHGSIRLAVGGYSQGGERGLSIEFRPVMHDLTDPPEGFGEGMAINFMTMSAKAPVDEEKRQVRPEALEILHVLMVAPREALLAPRSWTIEVAAKAFGECPEAACLRKFIRGGIGYAWRIRKAVAYTLAAGEAGSSPMAGQKVYLGPGILGGFYVPFSHDVRLESSLSVFRRLGRSDPDGPRALYKGESSTTLTWSFAKNQEFILNSHVARLGATSPVTENSLLYAYLF